MVRYARFVNIFILVGSMFGCSTANPINNSTDITSSLTATVEATRTRLPTATRRPSATPSPSPTINLTVVPITQTALTAQSNALATYSMQETLVPQFPRVCENLIAAREFSPNGMWLAETCYSVDDKDIILTLSNKDSQVLWKALFRDSIPQMDFVPDGWFSVAHWSNDGRYVYFFPNFGGSGGECFYQSKDRGHGLFRLDLQSGWITTILRSNNEVWWYSFSFSPTDRRLVYGEQARDLKFLDLTNREISQIISEESNYETGGYLWSSDGLQLAYSALTRNEQDERENYSLRLVDVQTGNEQILLEAPDKCFSALTWETTGALIVESEGSEGKTIIVISPSATPSP